MITHVDYEGLEFTVHFDYQPAEPRTRDYPGCVSEVQIYIIEINDVNIIDILDLGYLEEMAQDILEEYERKG